MKLISLAVAAAAGLAGTTTVFASDNGWYLFGAVGQAKGSAIRQLVDHELTYAGKNGFAAARRKIRTADVFTIQRQAASSSAFCRK